MASATGTVDRLADVAQLVERNLAKVEVAGSNLVVRSRRWLPADRSGASVLLAHDLSWACSGDVAEWLGSGLQSRVQGFDSPRRLDSPARRMARRSGMLDR